jgi:hypothetical protein
LIVNDNDTDILMNTNIEAEIENNIGRPPNKDMSLLLQLLRNYRFLLFLFITLLIGIVKAISAIYLLLYLSGMVFYTSYYILC